MTVESLIKRLMVCAVMLSGLVASSPRLSDAAPPPSDIHRICDLTKILAGIERAKRYESDLESHAMEAVMGYADASLAADYCADLRRPPLPRWRYRTIAYGAYVKLQAVTTEAGLPPTDPHAVEYNITRYTSKIASDPAAPAEVRAIARNSFMASCTDGVPVYRRKATRDYCAQYLANASPLPREFSDAPKGQALSPGSDVSVSAKSVGSQATPAPEIASAVPSPAVAAARLHHALICVVGYHTYQSALSLSAFLPKSPQTGLQFIVDRIERKQAPYHAKHGTKTVQARILSPHAGRFYCERGRVRVSQPSHLGCFVRLAVNKLRLPRLSAEPVPRRRLEASIRGGRRLA